MTGKSRAFWLYAKMKPHMGSFHPFRLLLKILRFNRVSSTYKGKKSQDKVIAERHSTSIVNPWDSQSSSKAPDARQLVKLGNAPLPPIIVSGNWMSLATRPKSEGWTFCKINLIFLLRFFCSSVFLIEKCKQPPNSYF